MKPIIKVEGLSKQYRVGTRSIARPTLREAFIGKFASTLPWRARNESKEDRLLWALRDVSFEIGTGGVIGRDRDHVAPRTREEKALAKIIAEVLNVDRVGVNDNFFELGGHSLLGIQVIARVRRVFRVELPLRRLFEEPTIAGLCATIARAERSGDGPVASPSHGVTSRDQLLARLAGLSDAEVETLLKNIATGEQGERVIEEF